MLGKCLRKRFCIVILTSAILILGLLGYHFRNYIKYTGYYAGQLFDISAVFLLNKQKLLIDIPPDIQEEDISIEWNANLFGSPPRNRVIFDGNVRQKKIPFATGSHGFSVFFKGELLKTVGHFAISPHAYHNYIFNFEKTGDSVELNFKADGPDSLTQNLWDKMYLWTKGPLLAKELNIPLSVPEASDTIKNSLNFELRPHNFERLIIPGVDTVIKKISCTMGNDVFAVKSLKHRGTSSLQFARKNYNVKLESPLSIMNAQGKSKNLYSFTLLSLAMDQYYVRTLIAHKILRELKLMNMFHAFTEMQLNGKSQGIYMIVENPKKHLEDSLNAAFHIRRGFEFSLNPDQLNVDNKLLDYEEIEIMLPERMDAILARYSEIHHLIEELEGKQLYEALAGIMELEEYMRLMAFNYIVCNHDYTDEIYFYIERQSTESKFRFLQWDFDDIIGQSPHEGWKRRLDLAGDKLVFSVENNLDRAIASDSFLYEKYLHVLQDITSALDAETILSIFQEVYNELYPFYNNPDILGLSELDAYATSYTPEDLHHQVFGICTYLSQRIHLTDSKLDKR